MNDKQHLPIFGIGPVCAALMACMLATGLALWRMGMLESGSFPELSAAFTHAERRW